MTQDLLYSSAGIILFCLGLFGVLIHDHIIRKLIAINIMGLGVFTLLLSSAMHGEVTDPVPHAMVLTGIVVAVAGTALCLWLTLQVRLLDKANLEDPLS